MQKLIRNSKSYGPASIDLRNLETLGKECSTTRSLAGRTER